MKVQTNYFTDVYNATYDKVLSYVLVKCGKTEDVEDILQETYAELFSVLHKRGEAYINFPEAFVMQLAKSKVYQYYSEKEQQKLYASMESLEAAEEKGLLQQESCCMVQNMEDVLIDKLTTQEVMEYISEKDELTREIFYQHYFEDKTLKEIAKNCRMKESTVKNRLYRTLKELGSAKKFLCILVILLLAALLAKPVYSLAENVISKLKRYFEEDTKGTLDIIALGAVYREYKVRIEQGEFSDDVCIDISGVSYSLKELEEIWVSNPWLEDIDWANKDAVPINDIVSYDTIYQDAYMENEATDMYESETVMVEPTESPKELVIDEIED